jgi:hypothetical protein
MARSYPPRQKAASFHLDSVKASLLETQKTVAGHKKSDEGGRKSLREN